MIQQYRVIAYNIMLDYKFKYIYIYIERERDVHIYIYIHIHIAYDHYYQVNSFNLSSGPWEIRSVKGPFEVTIDNCSGICMYICMCMYVYIYIHTYMHIIYIYIL